MKIKLLFILFIGACDILNAQNKETLFPSDFAITKIDTTSIDRVAERAHVTVFQEPSNDSIAKQKFLTGFAEKYRDALEVKVFKLRLGCDCEKDNLIIINTWHQSIGRDSINYLSTRIIDGDVWFSASAVKSGYKPNDNEKQLINTLCSKYSYKVNDIIADLYIEEIPDFLQKNPESYLVNVEKEVIACSLPYKSFELFNNDTTAFMKYNFVKRAICYRDKTVAEVLTDLQLKPKSSVVLSSVWTDKYMGIRIHVDNLDVDYRIQNPKAKTQCVYIYWKDLLDDKDVTNLIRTYNSDVWVQQHYDFFKDNIVGRVVY